MQHLLGAVGHTEALGEVDKLPRAGAAGAQRLNAPAPSEARALPTSTWRCKYSCEMTVAVPSPSSLRQRAVFGHALLGRRPNFWSSRACVNSCANTISLSAPGTVPDTIRRCFERGS
jgi:hypothetical protein